MERIEIIYSNEIDAFSIESSNTVIVNISLATCLPHYLKTGNNKGIRILTHYLSDVFSGSLPPIQTKQQIIDVANILPNWFVLYDTDNMLIDNKWYLPQELKTSVGIASEPDYYEINRMYSWKLLELLRNRIDFNMRTNWNRNLVSDI